MFDHWKFFLRILNYPEIKVSTFLKIPLYYLTFLRMKVIYYHCIVLVLSKYLKLFIFTFVSFKNILFLRWQVAWDVLLSDTSKSHK